MIFLHNNPVDDQPCIVPYDDKPPTSSMISQKVFIYINGTYLDSTYCGKLIDVYWQGVDIGPSGLAYYDVQYKTITFEFDPYECHPAIFPPDPSWYNPIEKSEWIDWQIHTTNTSAVLEVESDMLYLFRCRASDYCGNIEPWPLLYDTYTLSIGIENPQQLTLELIEKVNEINEYRPYEEIMNMIQYILFNQAPVADAGEDCYGGLDKSPRIYEDAKHAVSDIDPHQHYTEMEFNGSASYDPDGEIVEYFWNFGDGTHGFGEVTSHSYTVPGEYNVTLTVTDNYGKIDQDSIVCTIGVVC
jgi:hypothetical protein